MDFDDIEDQIDDFCYRKFIKLKIIKYHVIITYYFLEFITCLTLFLNLINIIWFLLLFFIFTIIFGFVFYNIENKREKISKFYIYFTKEDYDDDS